MTIKAKIRLLFLSLWCCIINAGAQITLKYDTPKKDQYALGEIIDLQIKMKCTPETCLSGMKQSKIYVSGLEIEEQTDWKELSKATFQKQLKLKIVPGKKKTSKLTILRKVDKESLFLQETFQIK